jgi:hypothetical protein
MRNLMAAMAAAPELMVHPGAVAHRLQELKW